MAIQIEDISIVIPRYLIDRIYPGGSKALIEEEAISDNFYDDELVRFGASDSIEVGTIIELWTERGLRDIRKRKGKRSWIDLCVIDHLDGPTLPCKWIRTENNRAEFVS